MDDSNSSPTRLPLDETIDQQAGESFGHWAGKAAVVEYLNRHPAVAGTVEVERKVEDLIADIRCNLTSTPPDVPEWCVIEVQTNRSTKNVLQATRRYHRFGYAVFWIFHHDAAQQRRTAEATLEEQLADPPALGRLSLSGGELDLGKPLRPGDLATQRPVLTCNEMYIPTYHRPRQAYDHGDFTIGDEGRLALLTIDDSLYVSHEIEDTGQRTLPYPHTEDPLDIATAFRTNTITRTSPVRGPP